MPKAIAAGNLKVTTNRGDNTVKHDNFWKEIRNLEFRIFVK
jgi:hypothetical protein